MEKNRCAILTISILLLLLLHSSAMADIWYVAPAPSGSDTSGNGSQSYPFATINHTLGVIQSSADMIILNPGIYNENVVIPSYLTGIAIRSTAHCSMLPGYAEQFQNIIDNTVIQNLSSGPTISISSNAVCVYILGLTIKNTGGGDAISYGQAPDYGPAGYLSLDYCCLDNAVEVISAEVDIRNCVFNVSGTYSITAMNYFVPGTYSQIADCLFKGNDGHDYEIQMIYTNEYIVNCSFLSKTTSGAALLVSGWQPSYPTFVNCLFAPGENTNAPYIYISGNGTRITRNCCIAEEDYNYDAWNYDAAVSHWDSVTYVPNSSFYMDWVDSNYRLTNVSPCINSGNLTLYQQYSTPNYDVFGQQRFLQGKIDIGAEETAFPMTWHVDGSRVSSGNGQSWGQAFKTIGEAVSTAAGADTVLVAPGTYAESINISSKSFKLAGQDPSTGLAADAKDVVITGNNPSCVISLANSESVIENISIGHPATPYNRKGILFNNTGYSNPNPVQVKNCIIQNLNQTGVYVNNASINVSNCLIQGTGIATYGSGSSEITHCTVTDASCGIYNNGANLTIRNCIVWDCVDSLVGCTATYSCIQNGSGATIISDAPQFINAAGRDYRLALASPCVDTGTDAVVYTDIDGTERLKNLRSSPGIYDMGAYECRLFEAGKKTPDGWMYDYVYYGHLHNHCRISDGRLTANDAYSTARTNGLDFFGLADHAWQMTSAEFTTMRDAAEAYLQKRLYTTFWGFEWTSGTYGHVAVIRPADVQDPNEYCTARSTDPANPATHPLFSDLVGWLDTHECVAFFNHPGSYNTSGLEFEHFSGAFSEKIVGMELWNKAVLFDTFYYNSGYVTPDLTNRSGYFDEALQNGWRIGAAGSQDHHGETWGAENAMLAIPANVNTREELYAALQARRFYSTIDRNIMLSFEVNGQPMGSCVWPGQSHCVIKAKDADAGNFTKIELIHNGNIIKTWGTSDFANPQQPVVEWDVVMAKGDYLYCTVSQTPQPAQEDAVAVSSPVFSVIASDPNPVNGGSNIPTDITLQASVYGPNGAGSLVNVSFYGKEKANPSYSLIGSQSNVPSGSTASIQWHGLSSETEYEWFVTVTEPVTLLSDDSPIWSFTTGTCSATEPNPADGAVLVPVDSILNWTPGAGAVSHDVYFGTDPQPPLVSPQQSGSTYTPSLEYGTTYYWAVDEYSADSIVTPGPVWSFTTTPLSYMEGFESYSINQQVGSHPSWYDGGSGPVVTSGAGVGSPASVGLAPAKNIFTWLAYPFSWSNVDKVIIGMDFQTDGSKHLDDDRVGWMTTNTSFDSPNFFGVQLDPGGSEYNIETYWKNSSQGDARVTIANLPSLTANAWYRLRAEFTRLTATSASIDVELWSLDANGAPLNLVASGSIPDTSTLGTNAPAVTYFNAATVWPAYKNYKDGNKGLYGAADNAYFELIP